MAERGPPAPRMPTMHKPMKTKATEPAKIVDHPQQNPPQPGPQPQLEVEVLLHPDQVPDLSPPNPTRPSCP